MLDPLGLKSATESVYRLLLEHPSWGIKEMSTALDYPEAQVRTALDELADLHLLNWDTVAPDTPQPVSPRIGLVSLLAKQEAELAILQRRMDVARAAVSELVEEYNNPGYELEIIERIVGLDTVRYRLTELARSARRECLSFLPGGPQDQDAMDASQPLDHEALERGIEIRTIYQDSFRNDPASLRYVRWLTSLGGECRTVPALPTSLVIVDRESALVPLDPDSTQQGALHLKSPALIAPLCALFDVYWSLATPWTKRPAIAEDGISSQERELLSLLAAGHTDESAGRVLGVSLRTVRRMASDLMHRLDAKSRFEAGVRAAQRGWVSERTFSTPRITPRE